MTVLHLLVGTTSGNTEFLADTVSEKLNEQGIETELHYEPEFEKLPTDQPWLVFLASHGAGDYADSMLDFYDEINDPQSPDLTGLNYAVVAIGESCYDTFCEAGRHCDSRLQELGAIKLADRLEIDMLEDDPEQKALSWLPAITDSIKAL
jgi:MioC protein